MYLCERPTDMHSSHQESQRNKPNSRHDLEGFFIMKQRERRKKIKEIEARHSRVTLHYLKIVMAEENLNANQISNYTGIDPQAIRNWISGKSKPSRLSASNLNDFLATYYDRLIESLD